jgi:hypothetical protein
VGSWLLHHNNVPAHTTLSVPTLPLPPCSTDLSRPDFLLFSKLKITLKRRRFQTVKDIITNATKDLKVIPQTSFKQCLQKWKKLWERCIAAQGDCFEGDK